MSGKNLTYGNPMHIAA